MFHGFGYEAFLVYNTNSTRRAETHLLYHNDADGLAAKFASSSKAQTFKGVFAGWIKKGVF